MYGNLSTGSVSKWLIIFDTALRHPMCHNFFFSPQSCFSLTLVHVSATFGHPATSSQSTSRRNWTLQSWIKYVEMSRHQIRVSFLYTKQRHIGEQQMLIRGDCRLQFLQKYAWNPKPCCLFAFCFLKVEPNPLSDLQIFWSCSLSYSKDLALRYFALHNRENWKVDVRILSGRDAFCTMLTF